MGLFFNLRLDAEDELDELRRMLQAAGDDAAPGVPVGGTNTLRRSM